YNKKQLPDSAIADYTRAIAVKPDYSGAYTNRGNINFTKDRFDQAIEDYNQALKYDPSDAKTYLNRSFAWFRRGNLKEALNDAETAKSMNIDVNPNYLLDLKNRLAASK
ncbi:MAG: tetratricopeptide repeat protein, partial [bacterium]